MAALTSIVNVVRMRGEIILVDMKRTGGDLSSSNQRIIYRRATKRAAYQISRGMTVYLPCAYCRTVTDTYLECEFIGRPLGGT